MAATFVGQAGENARSDDCAVHADCVAGDLVIAVAADASLDSNAFNAPADPLEDANNGTNVGFGSGFDVVADNTYVFTAAVADRHRTRTFAFRDASGVTSRDPTFEGSDTSATFSSFSGGTGRYLLVGYTTSSSGSRSTAPSGWSYAVSNNFIFALLSDAELSSYDGSITVTLGNSVVKAMQVFCILPETANEYDLPADPGSYAITGSTAALEWGRLLSALSGSYLFSGQDATLQKALFLSASPGSYQTAGSDAALEWNRLITAAPGSYAVDGQNAGLSKGLLIPVSPGSYLISGNDATFIYNRILGVDPGSYNITGTAAGLLLSHAALSADPGSYIISGVNADLIYTGLNHYLLEVDPGSYNISGGDVTFSSNRLLPADPGSYLITGSDVDFPINRLLTALPGSYLIVGSNATLFLFPTQFDGLKFFHGTTQELSLVAVADAPSGDRLTIHNDGVEYAVYLVDTSDPFASTIRINTNDGIKAIRLRT